MEENENDQEEIEDPNEAQDPDEGGSESTDPPQDDGQPEEPETPEAPAEEPDSDRVTIYLEVKNGRGTIGLRRPGTDPQVSVHNTSELGDLIAMLPAKL